MLLSRLCVHRVHVVLVHKISADIDDGLPVDELQQMVSGGIKLRRADEEVHGYMQLRATDRSV